MGYLTDGQIAELTDTNLIDKEVIITRKESRLTYKLCEYKKGRHGMKGVVWKATDDIGPVALKIIPEDEYLNKSLIDEIHKAHFLDPNYFATIKFFGDISIPGVTLQCKAITTEWVDGISLKEYIDTELRTVDQFLRLVDQLFSALGDLRNKELCHDDLHLGNIMMKDYEDPLTHEIWKRIKIIDTGTIKRIQTRDRLLYDLNNTIKILEESGGDAQSLQKYKDLKKWKEPGDHLRVTECLLEAANGLMANYYRLDFWERKLLDELGTIFSSMTDDDLSRRLDSPDQVVNEISAIARSCKYEKDSTKQSLKTPFDYISAEMIRADRQFTELFSKEFPWLIDCAALEPLWIYGPRGCGKSSVLRYLSFKAILADPNQTDYSNLKDIGIYLSCSVELRSRFLILTEETIDHLQTPIIRYFNLLLLEQLFETLDRMNYHQSTNNCSFGLSDNKQRAFTSWVISRLNLEDHTVRLQGLGYFEYLRMLFRTLKWDTWSDILNKRNDFGIPDPSLASDIARELSVHFEFFKDCHVTFLIDDYSNQRIPRALQVKLNKTITFAKQGTPIFKVTSEYGGVDLEGIQEGREVVNINIGEKYTSLSDNSGHKFLADIINLRLKATEPPYISTIEKLLGDTPYESIARALAAEKPQNPFYYHGLQCIHWVCSGDLALAMSLIRQIFSDGNVTPSTEGTVVPIIQHKTIQDFSYNEVRGIKYITPFGMQMHAIIRYLGPLARAYVMNKRSTRKDRRGKPASVTHIDIRTPIISELKEKNVDLYHMFDMLRTRAVLFSLETSRSRIESSTERLQIRRIYLPAFKAPLQRDTPIKIDILDDLISLLTEPRTFCERELTKSAINIDQLNLALQDSLEEPRE